MNIKIRNFAASTATFADFEWIDKTKGSAGPDNPEKLVLSYKTQVSKNLANNEYVKALNELLMDAKSIPINLEFVISFYEFYVYGDHNREIAKLVFYDDERGKPNMSKVINATNYYDEKVIVDDVDDWKREVKSILKTIGVRF